MAINCPKCGGDAYCHDSRKEKDSVKRRLICKECDYRYSSVEVVMNIKKKGFKNGTTAKEKMEMQLTAKNAVYNEVSSLLKQALIVCENGYKK